MDPLALAIAAIVSSLGIITALVKLVADKRRRDSERPVPPPQRERLPSVDDTGRFSVVVPDVSEVARELREAAQALRNASGEEMSRRLEDLADKHERTRREQASMRVRVLDQESRIEGVEVGQRAQDRRLDDHGQRIAGIELHLGEAPEGGQQ